VKKDQFLSQWRDRHNGTLPPLNNGEEFFYPGWASTYVRVGCPFCPKKGKGKDTSHHLHVHFERDCFKCMRCGTSGSTEFLLGRKRPKPTAWKTYTSRPENHKPNPAVLLFNQGPEPNRTRPGTCGHLRGLRRNHPAWQYLLKEGFTVREIEAVADKYHLGFCHSGRQMTHNPENTTTGRLIIPIIEAATHYGWQARWLPSQWPPTQEDNAKEALVDKYLFSPGFKKTHILYNWDEAQNWDMWVVVEGAKKVWKTGGFALATFGIGNNPTPPQDASGDAHDKHWAVRLAHSKRKIVLLYDKGTEAEEAAQNHARAIQTLGGEIQIAKLPAQGPDDLDRYSQVDILNIIKTTCKRLPKRVR
jgi:hypothetical protein